MADDVNKSKKPDANQSTKSSDVNGNSFTKIINQQGESRVAQSKADRDRNARLAEINKKQKIIKDVIEDVGLEESVEFVEMDKTLRINKTKFINRNVTSKQLREANAQKTALSQAVSYVHPSHIAGRGRVMSHSPEIRSAANTLMGSSDSELYSQKTSLQEGMASRREEVRSFIRQPNNFNQKGKLTKDAREIVSNFDAEQKSAELKLATVEKAISNKRKLGLDDNSQDLKAIKARQRHDIKRERLHESIARSEDDRKITDRVKGSIGANLGIGPDSYKNQNQKFFDAQKKAGEALDKLSDGSAKTAEDITKLNEAVDGFSKEMRDAEVAMKAHGKAPKAPVDGIQGKIGNVMASAGAMFAIASKFYEVGKQVQDHVVDEVIDIKKIQYASKMEDKEVGIQERQLANKKWDLRGAAIAGDMTALLAIGDTKTNAEGGLDPNNKGPKGWLTRDRDNGQNARDEVQESWDAGETMSGMERKKEIYAQSYTDKHIKDAGLGEKGLFPTLPVNNGRIRPEDAGRYPYDAVRNRNGYTPEQNQSPKEKPYSFNQFSQEVVDVVVENPVMQGIRTYTGGQKEMKVEEEEQRTANQYQIDKRKEALRADDLLLQKKMTQSHISGAMMQQTYEYSMGIREANNAIGGRAANSMMTEFANDPGGGKAGLLKTLQDNGISPEQFTAAAAQHGAQQGSMFKTSNIIDAKKMENAGFGSMELNLGRQDTLAAAGANNPTDDLHSIMSSAMTAGLEGSKALNAMVDHTAKMADAASVGKFGIDVTKEAGAGIAQYIDKNIQNKEQAEAAAADAASLINKTNKSVGNNFQDQVGLSQMVQASGMEWKTNVQLKQLEDPIANKMRGSLDKLSKMRDGDEKEKFRAETKLELAHLAPNTIKELGTEGLTDEKAGAIARAFEVRASSVVNSAQSMAEGLRPEDIKKTTKTFSQLSTGNKDEINLAAGIGNAANAMNITPEQYMTAVKSDIPPIPNQVAKDKLTNAPAEGSPLDNLNKTANAKAEEMAKQAGLAAEAFGGVALTVKAINTLMQQRLTELTAANANNVVNAGTDQGKGTGDTFNVGAIMRQPTQDLADAVTAAANALKPLSNPTGGTTLRPSGPTPTSQPVKK